jgi:hypothetical protein
MLIKRRPQPTSPVPTRKSIPQLDASFAKFLREIRWDQERTDFALGTIEGLLEDIDHFQTQLSHRWAFTRPAGSVRDRAILSSCARSSSVIEISMTRRGAAMMPSHPVSIHSLPTTSSGAQEIPYKGSVSRNGCTRSGANTAGAVGDYAAGRLTYTRRSGKFPTATFEEYLAGAKSSCQSLLWRTQAYGHQVGMLAAARPLSNHGQPPTPS